MDANLTPDDRKSELQTSEMVELQQRKQLELLTQLASELLVAQDPVDAVQALFQSLAAEFAMDVGFNYSAGQSGEKLRLDAWIGVADEEAQRIGRLEYGQAICGTVAETRRSMYVSHIQQSEDPRARLVKEYGVRAYACYPLMAGERLLGTLSFASRERDTFGQHELDFFRTVAQYVALAKERLRAEAALRASEQKARQQLAELELIYATAPVGHCVLDRELRYLRVNPRLAEIDLQPLDAFIGRTVREMVPRVADQVEPYLYQVLETGEPMLNVEISLPPDPDGESEQICLEHFYPIKNDDGWVIGINVIIDDITERKRIETALARERELLQKLFDNIPVMITVYDPEINEIQGNRAFEEITGWRNEESRNVDVMEHFYPDPAYREGVRAFMESLSGWRDLKVTVKDGSIVDSSWANIRLSDDRHVGIGVDIRERKRAEEQLRESEVRLRLALESGQMGMWDWDLGDVAIWNKRMCELFGVDGDGGAVSVKLAHSRMPADDAAEHQRLIDQVLDSGGQLTHEFRVLLPDGQIRWLTTVGRLFHDEGGRPVRMLGVTYDVTGQKEVEETLREQKQELALKNQQLQGLFDHAPAGLALFDAEVPYRVLANNKIYQQFFAEPFYSQGIIGRPLSEFAVRAEEDGILAVFREVVSSGEGKTVYNFPYDGLPGGRHWFHWHLSPICSEGEVVALAHMSIDVTQQVKAQQQLEEELLERKRVEREREHLLARIDSERAHLEAILNQMPSGVIIAEAPSGELVMVNQQVNQILRNKELNIATTAEFAQIQAFHSDGTPYQPHEWPLHRAICDGAIIPMEEIEVKRGDGTRAIVATSAAPIRNKDGTITAGVVIFRDITAQKETEAALRESEELFRLALQDSPIFIYTNDQELRYTWVYNLPSNYWQQDILGRRDDELMPAESAAALIAFKEEVLAHEQTLRREFRFELESGVVEYDVTAEPLRNAAGHVVGLTAAVMDVTELRGHTRQLQQLNDTLEERVRKRTSQVRQLASELTLAEQRERRRIAQILHDDIQQMLVSLQMNLHLVAQNTEGELAAKLRAPESFVNDIIEATRSLSSELSSPVLNSERLRDGLVWLAYYMGERYKLQVELDVDDECRVSGRDLRELVVQLVRELLFNTVKHAGVNQARLHARDEEDHVVIRVEDDGKGFDVAIMDNPGGATGFGLYSIRERLDLFGGHFEIDSAPGTGTRARVVIPKLWRSD